MMSMSMSPVARSGDVGGDGNPAHHEEVDLLVEQDGRISSGRKSLAIACAVAQHRLKVVGLGGALDALLGRQGLEPRERVGV